VSRRKLIAGNWKLHLTPAESAALARDLRAALAGADHCDQVVFPQAMSLAAVCEALNGSPIAVGCQWTHAEPQGAWTGCNSARVARAIGCGWSLAGHSEVRRDLGETDARVNASALGALNAGLLPVICVGETLDERRAGQLEAVLERQLREGLAHFALDQLLTVTIAYEPVWAIGTGVVATPDQAQQAHAFVRSVLTSLTGSVERARQIRTLYGGSVTADNARTLLSLPDVDGCLVGGASLKVPSFAAIVDAAA
jgi:triosephosphate isomerase